MLPPRVTIPALCYDAGAACVKRCCGATMAAQQWQMAAVCVLRLVTSVPGGRGDGPSRAVQIGAVRKQSRGTTGARTT
eukprot:3274776-Rhodomonas_salina.1